MDNADSHKIKDLAERYADNIEVLEEPIDIALQKEYFYESKLVKKEPAKQDVATLKHALFNPEASLSDKRRLLCQLASMDDVCAFRTIEAYLKHSDNTLVEWATLAFQESKMLMQSSLSESTPVFISTGLGGKDNKLRYFCVLSSNNFSPLSESHQKLVKSEIEYEFKSCNAQLETMEHYGYFFTVTALIPIEVGLKKTFSNIIQKCNELGNFLSTSFLISNARKLSMKEVEQMIIKNNTNQASE